MGIKRDGFKIKTKIKMPVPDPIIFLIFMQNEAALSYEAARNFLNYGCYEEAKRIQWSAARKSALARTEIENWVKKKATE